MIQLAVVGAGNHLTLLLPLASLGKTFTHQNERKVCHCWRGTEEARM